MTTKNENRIGILFSIMGLAFAVVFTLPVSIELNPELWLKPSYYTQFLPVYLAVLLNLSGLFVLARISQANFYLAAFGHTASEEILFHWLGWLQTPLPLYSVFIFFPLSLLALWLAYANTLKTKRLSWSEALFGLVMSLAFVLAPRYL